MNTLYRQRAVARDRRRFLALLGAVGASLLALPWLPRSDGEERLSLREADFYRRGGT